MENLKSQKNRIYEILSDGQAHRSDEITYLLFGTADTARTGLFRLGGRIYDLRAQGHKIERWQDEKNRSLTWYRLVKDREIEPIIEKSAGKQMPLLNVRRYIP